MNKTKPKQPIPVAPPKRTDKTVSKVIGVKRLARACGHEADFPFFEGEPVGYTAGRYAKWVAKRCLPCVQADEVRLHAEAVARRQQRGRDFFRLLDGSKFIATYDAARRVWSVELTVPRDGGDPFVIAKTASGLHGALHRLGCRARKEGLYTVDDKTRAGSA